MTADGQRAHLHRCTRTQSKKCTLWVMNSLSAPPFDAHSVSNVVCRDGGETLEVIITVSPISEKINYKPDFLQYDIIGEGHKRSNGWSLSRRIKHRDMINTPGITARGQI